MGRIDSVRWRAFPRITRPQGIHRGSRLPGWRGQVWLGTLAIGALRLARNGFSVLHRGRRACRATIRGVFESRAGGLFVVSNNQRIHHFDGRGFTAVRPNLSEDVAELVNPAFPFQTARANGGSRAGRTYWFPNVDDRELGHVRPKAVHTTRDGLAGDDVFTLFEDFEAISGLVEDADLFGPDEVGAGHGDLSPVTDVDGLPPFNRTPAFAEDHAGNVWIGFQNGGLARYRNGRFMLFTHADGAPAAGISALYLDHARRLWVGSVRPGLTRIEDPAADRPRFIPYPIAHGLSDDAVGCITEDQLGRLYLGWGSGHIDRLIE